MLSKKHYKAIAEMLYKKTEEDTIYSYDCGSEGLAVQSAFEYFAEDLADYFAEDNPNFDRNKFLKACGVTN